MSGPEAWVLLFSANAVLSGKGTRQERDRFQQTPTWLLILQLQNASCTGPLPGRPGGGWGGAGLHTQGRLAARAPGQAI